MVEGNKTNIKGELPRTRSSFSICNKDRKKEETSVWKGSGLEMYPSGGQSLPVALTPPSARCQTSWGGESTSFPDSPIPCHWDHSKSLRRRTGEKWPSVHHTLGPRPGNRPSQSFLLSVGTQEYRGWNLEGHARRQSLVPNSRQS